LHKRLNARTVLPPQAYGDVRNQCFPPLDNQID
jgi:hypothetical protein